MGGDIEFGDDTSWAVHENKTLDDLKPFYFDEQNIWYRRMMSITEELLKDSRGDYLVGNNDFHTTIGALASLIGPEEMCVSLLTDPETVKERLNEGQAVYHIVFQKISELIERYQKGHTNWMGLYCDKNWYVPSCDESCLISVEAFEEFVVPHLKEELKMFSRAIYHLDGKDALRHLDVLLSIKEIDGIQWVYGEGQPTARHWIPLLQKIQKAGKRIEICVEKDDIKPLLENLAPQGLSMRTRAKNETEAKEMVAFVQNFRKA